MIHDSSTQSCAVLLFPLRGIFHQVKNKINKNKTRKKLCCREHQNAGIQKEIQHQSKTKTVD